MAQNNKKTGEVIIISEELLKLHSVLGKNVSVDKVYPFLTIAQPYYLEPVLGKALLTELQVQVDTDTLTDTNKALILKIAPVLSNWATYLAMRSLTYTISEKGVTAENSENSRSIDNRELGEYIIWLKQICEMATDNLIRFLCECSDLYPLWRPLNDCNCEKYLPTDGSAKNTYHNLVYFPNKKDNGCDKCSPGTWIRYDR